MNAQWNVWTHLWTWIHQVYSVGCHFTMLLKTFSEIRSAAMVRFISLVHLVIMKLRRLYILQSIEGIAKHTWINSSRSAMQAYRFRFRVGWSTLQRDGNRIVDYWSLAGSQKNGLKMLSNRSAGFQRNCAVNSSWLAWAGIHTYVCLSSF